jgi:hypothetical protein
MLLPSFRTAVLTASLAVSLAVACGSDDSSDGDGTGGTAATGGSSGTTAGGGGSAGSAGSAGLGGSSATGGSAGQAGSTSTGGSAGSGGSGGAGDADGDGLDDALELTLATDNFPFHSLAPNDDCPLNGVVFRATPHPDSPAHVMIWYVVLFQNDCGANGHVGDDEVFGVVVDPTLAAPQSILAVRAISHQGTICEGNTTCGTLPGCNPCTTATKNGASFPVVFASVDKHGQYVVESTCDANFICDFGGCTLNPTPNTPPLVNAGEPNQPLVTDLSAQGFITAANGWTEASLMGFNPWSNQEFGSAGNVSDDLTDAAFVIPLSGCN